MYNILFDFLEVPMPNFYYEKYVKPIAHTPKGRFIAQRQNACRRGIEWNLTFDEWWKIWEESGKWDLRGRGIGKFCMSRILDNGPYSKENVRILSFQKNSKQNCFTGNII